MIKKMEKLDEYLGNVNFGVLDLDKTSSKWSNYKNEKWEKEIFPVIEENYLSQINNPYFSDNLQCSFYSQPYRASYLLDNLSNKFCKSNIKPFKSEINFRMIKFNEDYLIFEFPNLSKAELNGFTIRLYLHYYKEINIIMKDVLSDIAYAVFENLEESA